RGPRTVGLFLTGLLLMGLVPAVPAGALGRGPTVESARLQDRPTSGPAGTQVEVLGRNFAGLCLITLSFTDAAGTSTFLGSVHGPSFDVQRTIPVDAAPGSGRMSASQGHWDIHFRIC